MTTQPDYRERLTRCVRLMYADDPAMVDPAVCYVLEGGQPPPQPTSWPQSAWDAIREVTSLVAERPPDELVRWGTVLRTVDGAPPTPADSVVPQWYEALAHWAERVGPAQIAAGIGPGTQTTLSVAALEVALHADGHDAAASVLVITTPWPFSPPGSFLPDFHLSVRRHTDAIFAWWQTATTQEQHLALSRLVCLDDETLAPFVPFVIDAVGRSATAAQEIRFGYPKHPSRDVSNRMTGPRADKLSRWFGAECFEVWRRIGAEGTPPQRKQALTLLWAEGDEATKDWAWATATADPSVTVRRLTQRWDPDSAVGPADVVSDHGDIETTARQAMSKKLPGALVWLVEAGLPPLRWADGQPVLDVVWQWWAKVSVDARRVEPTSVVRAGAALVEPSSAQAFAVALLEAWIAQDAPSEALVAEAAARAAQRRPSPSWSTIDAVLYQMQGNRRPSASSSRGVLALVVALGGPGVDVPVERYLRAWSRRVTESTSARFTQMMALIEVLAWVDDESARALLATLPTWIYQRRLVRHTWEQLTELAARLGTTAAELADRPTPLTGGVDNHGELHLDYGPRSFVACLNDDLTWEIRDDTGRVRRALPPCATNDDPEAVAHARARFSEVNASVRELVSVQAARLHELMLIGHTWPGALWTGRFGTHPIMSRLARCLLWQTVGTTDPSADGFRPLADGTLTSVHDDVVADLQAPVRLVHGALVSDQQRDMCSAHLHDYQVASLFDQLSTEAVVLTDLDATEMTALRGRSLPSRDLRAQATSRGWRYDETIGLHAVQRGDQVVQQVWDESRQRWVRATTPVEQCYDKQYRTVWISARIGFTTPVVVEKDPPATLTVLRFTRDGQVLRLADVPPALLAESWADMNDIAASSAGPGKDQPA
ncbi:MAG: DUF4132 domain-containing protein [Micrococcales bacterium]|nr:DUF4132 domain-containing protein [Micrococcales bacterium]